MGFGSWFSRTIWRQPSHRSTFTNRMDTGYSNSVSTSNRGSGKSVTGYRINKRIKVDKKGNRTLIERTTIRSGSMRQISQKTLNSKSGVPKVKAYKYKPQKMKFK